MIKAKMVIQALSECNHAVIHIKSEVRLLRAICRIVVHVGGYRMAWVGYAEEDREQTVTPVAKYGYEKDYLETVKVTWKDAERGRGPTGTSIRTGIPGIIRSVGNQAEFAPWKEEASKRGYASVIGLPLFLDGQRLGALTIYSSETDAFDTEEVEFLLKLSANLSYGIGVLRLRKAQMQAEESLKEANLDLERRVEERTAELVEVNTELRKEVEERRRVEDELFNSRQMLRSVLDTVPQRVFWKDRNSVYVGCNKPFLLDYGYEDQNGLVGKTDYETASAAIADLYRADDREVMDSGRPKINYEEQLIRSDGAKVWVITSKAPMYNRDGQVIGVLGTYADITGRKLMEEDLRQTNEYLENIFENSPDSIAIVDSHGRFIRWNKMAEALLGYTVEEMKGKSGFDLYADKAELEKMLVSMHREGSVKKREMRMARKDGSIVPLEMSIGLLKDSENRTLGSVAVARDLSERKRLEEKVQAQLDFLQTLIDTIPNPIFYKDANGRYTGCNRAFLELTGKSMEEILGKTVYDLGLKDIADGYEEKDRELFERPGKQQYEWKLQNTLGEVRTVIFDKATLLDAHAAVSGLVGVISDITERKRIEERLRESDELFRTIFENSSSAMAIVEKDTTISMVNKEYCRLSLYEKEDVIGTSWTKQIPPEDLERLKEYNRKRLLDPESAPGKYEFTYYRKDGEIRHSLMSVAMIPTIQKIICSFLDITERKRAEEALAASEEMFRLLVESAPDAILVQTRGLWAYANPEAMKLFRASSKDQLIGKPVMDTVHPDYRETVRARIHSANVQKKRVPAREQKYIVLDGAIVDVETSAVPIRYENEDGALVFVRNITGRKKGEEALRKSEARLSLAINQAGMGTWDADLLTGKAVWSKSFFRLLGYEPHPDSEATVEMWRSRVHMEDRERVSQDRERERVEHSERMREYRVLRADTNEVVWLSVFARCLYDENGEAVRHIGIAFDSTVRKRMEEELRRSNDELDLTIYALSEKTQNLEEINAALRVLLRQREEDKKELRDSVVANVRNLILPYTEKLKQSPLSSVQMIWMRLLESHINEITSSFGRTLAAQYANLTYTEIRIATLVRDGISTARIAELSGISEKTVCRHRDNIRKKLGLRRGGINLRTHLLSLQ